MLFGGAVAQLQPAGSGAGQFAALADLLARLDGRMPASQVSILAEGYVARLRRRAWESHTDILGSADDVEIMLGWAGPNLKLAAALRDAGFLREVRGLYIAADAVTEAPEYVRKRWMRADRKAYNAARRRSDRPSVRRDEDRTSVEALESPAAERENHVSDSPAPAPVPAAAEPGHRQFIRYFDARYKQCINPSGYVWNDGRDFRDIKKLLLATHYDVPRLCRAIDAYFADRTAFYVGHPIYKFVRDFSRFDGTRAAGRPAGERIADLPADAGIL